MIDISGLHTELEAAGLPVVGVSSDGRIDYARALTPAEQATGNAGGSVTFAAAAQNIDSMFVLPLAAGDVGVKAVSTINVATATTTGVANLLLVKRLVQIPLIANIGTVIDFTRAYPPMPRIFDGATLALAIVAGGTSATTVQGVMTFGWG